MQTEQLINQIFQENFSKAKDSPLHERLIEATIGDYKRNQEAIEKLNNKF